MSPLNDRCNISGLSRIKDIKICACERATLSCRLEAVCPQVYASLSPTRAAAAALVSLDNAPAQLPRIYRAALFSARPCVYARSRRSCAARGARCTLRAFAYTTAAVAATGRFTKNKE